MAYYRHMIGSPGIAAETRGDAAGARPLLTGSAGEVAADIRQYAALGVTHLVVDFARISASLDDMQRRMEAFATQVWLQV